MIDIPRRRPGDSLAQDLVRRTLEHIDNDDPQEILQALTETAWPSASSLNQ